MPTRGTAQQTGFLLQRAHRRLRAAHNEALRPLGLTIAHVAVAGLLADGGDLSQRQLLEIMDADKSTMVNLIDELESQGLVERRRHPSDRRAHAVHLTEAGRRRLVTIGELVSRIEDDFLAPLSTAERNRLKALLRRVADHQPPDV
jgi:DNA-binding MarR family transcriptional regulator